MGRTYYCEYCDKTFRDNVEMRKSHLNGALHQQMKKEHFDRFRDVKTLLEEERARVPCSRIMNGQECTFGLRCRFSHYKPWELDEIERRDKEETKEPVDCRIKNVQDIPLPPINDELLPPSMRKWTETSSTCKSPEWGELK